ncbi:MAG: DUF3363 domain-containing protein [Xanthobacteraceae bacterium]
MHHRQDRRIRSGKFAGSTQLTSGRFAMIDDGTGFQLLPWQSVLDKRIGQHISGIMRNGGGGAVSVPNCG